MRSWKTLADIEYGPNPENNERMEYLWREEKVPIGKGDYWKTSSKERGCVTGMLAVTCRASGTELGKSFMMKQELIYERWALFSMKLENHLLEMFSYKIVITHKQLMGTSSAPSDTKGLWCVRQRVCDVFAQAMGLLQLLTAPRTNC